MNNQQLVMVMVFGVLLAGAPVQAQMHEEHEHKGSMMEHDGSMMDKSINKESEMHVATEEDIKELPNVGNKFCPVSKNQVDDGSMGEAVKFVYNGKIYNLCCSMCIKDFKKNPEKYSKIAEDEAKKYEEEEGEVHEGDHVKDDGHHHEHDHGHDE